MSQVQIELSQRLGDLQVRQVFSKCLHERIALSDYLHLRVVSANFCSGPLDNGGNRGIH